MRIHVARRLVWLVLTIAALAAVLPIASSHATIFGDDNRTPLGINPGRPYNAVGFLNNGCTATLIDTSHILTAAHCVADFGTGNWQSGLRFFPNFHPERVRANQSGVPHANVLRAVAATRVELGNREGGNDWAIARLGPWRNIGVMDLTPATVGDIHLSEFSMLEQPDYARHFLPAYRSTHVLENCDGARWMRNSFAAPIIDGKAEPKWCNARWAEGQIHSSCWARQHVNREIRHNCDTSGGSSGSPLIYRDYQGVKRVVGVTGGFDHNFVDPDGMADTDGPVEIASAKYDPSDVDDLNYAAPAERFVDTPRFASNVSLARRTDGAAATAVFAIDSDRNRVVFRQRGGDPATYTSDFTNWWDLGAPTNAVATRIASCPMSGANPKPRVFALLGARLYTRYATGWGPQFSAWAEVALPSGITGLADVDTTSDAAGRCQLFAVARSGAAFTRQMTSDTTFSVWVNVANGYFHKISALKSGDTQVAIMIDTAGRLWRTANAGGGWSTAYQVAFPSGVTAFKDADLGYDELGNGRIWAYAGGANLHRQNLTRGSAWATMQTSLWHPAGTTSSPVDLESITASRWMEDAPGVTSPVVFGTGTDGNVYVIEYRRYNGTTAWVPRWKSFYSTRILG